MVEDEEGRALSSPLPFAAYSHYSTHPLFS